MQNIKTTYCRIKLIYYSLSNGYKSGYSFKTKTHSKRHQTKTTRNIEYIHTHGFEYI